MAQLPAVKRRRLSPPETDATTVTNNFYNNASQWNLEDAYEQRAKKQKKKDKANDRLPIKTREGRIEQAQAPEIPQEIVNGQDDAEDAAADGEEVEGEDAEDEEEPEPEKPLKEQIMEAQEDLARMAGLISEDPEEHIALLKNLAKIAANRNTTIKQLAMATQVAVFKDIIPGYRIRPASDEELKGKLSKDVKRLRTFEQTLVGCYREYVQYLAKAVKAGSRDATPKQMSVASTAITCTCTLLEAVPHFNFRSELLNILVSKLSGRNPSKDFVKAREAMQTLFENDEEGNSSLEAVTLLTKMMKSKDYNVHESVLNTFLSLRLLSEYSYRASTERVDKGEGEGPIAPKLKKKQREYRTKRERKIMKERKVVEQEMKEADAVVSHEERDKNQSDMLKQVFVAYFRILKMRKQSLMGAVLEGLARYAHLINQDFFGDILESLRDLISDHDLEDEIELQPAEDTDPEYEPPKRDRSRETLLCIVTAFALLQGQDMTLKATSSLHLDLSFFTQRLYNTVLPLSLDSTVETSAKHQHPSQRTTGKINVQTPALLLFRSLSSLLLPPTSTRSVPPTLVAAFTKRLLTASLHLPEKSALAILGLVKQVVKVHGNKVSGLWFTEERKGDGVFDMERVEVESSNPFASTVWEGELLRLHWSPKVREAAKGVVEGVVSRRE